LENIGFCLVFNWRTQDWIVSQFTFFLARMRASRICCWLTIILMDILAINCNKLLPKAVDLILQDDDKGHKCAYSASDKYHNHLIDNLPLINMDNDRGFEGNEFNTCLYFIINLSRNVLEEVYIHLPTWKRYVFLTSFEPNDNIACRFPNSIFLVSNGTKVKLGKCDNFLRNGKLQTIGYLQNNGSASLLANYEDESLLDVSMVRTHGLTLLP